MKYCTRCGKPSVDENKFCQGCGKAFVMAKPVPVITSKPKAEPKEEPKEKLKEEATVPFACGVLKDVLKSPLFLTAAILFSIIAFLSFFRDFAEVGGGVFLLGTSGTALFASYAVLCAALWILFAQAKKASENTMNGIAFLLLKIGAIVNVAVVVIDVGLSSIVDLIGGIANIFPGGGGLQTAVPSTSVLGFSILSILFAFSIVFCIVGIRFLESVKLTATKGITDFKVPQFLIVTCYIQAGINCVSIIYYLFYTFVDGGVINLLSSFCEAAFFIVIALCLAKYKKELHILQNYLKQVESGEPEQVVEERGAET